MLEDLRLGCLFPLMPGLGAFILCALGWAVVCSPGQPLTPWSSRCRMFTLFMLSPVLQRQKVAQRRWMEASAGNPSKDAALLLICLPRAVVRGCDWDKEGRIVLHPTRSWQQNQEWEMSFIPPRMVTPKVMSPSQQHTSTLLIFSRKMDP